MIYSSIKCTFILLFISFSVSSQNHPGGVSGSSMWLRADIGTTGTTPLTSWNNQSVGTSVTVNGSPNMNTSSTSYNYNPYVDLIAPAGALSESIASNRQCILLNGYTGLNGDTYGSLFWTSHLTDVSRTVTHLATVRGISTGAPANGTLCGGDNGGIAAYQLGVYDSDFDLGSSSGTWNFDGSTVPYNNMHLSSKQIVSANSLTGGTANTNAIWGGQNDHNSFQGHIRDWKGPAAEFIAFPSGLTNNQRRRVHTYLAIKYGTTLAHNYKSTSNSLIYNVGSYSNDIIGIGRDDIEALEQKQSHTNDDTVRVYIASLAAMNVSNTGNFSQDESYVVLGSNNGKLCLTPASMSEMPLGLFNCTLYSRIEREWKVQRTTMADNFNMDIKLAPCALPGSVNTTDLRFLVDDDGDFSNGGTQCYYNGDGTGIVISYTNPTITVSNISTTIIPDNSTKYVTIASINSITPLPAELAEFVVSCEQDKVPLNWGTASENDNDYFSVERSRDGIFFETIATIDGAGTSSSLQQYSWTDENPISGVAYYRLSQTDFNGTTEQFVTRSVNCGVSENINITPNPFENEFMLNSKYAGTITLVNYTGKVILELSFTAGKNSIQTNKIASGHYLAYITLQNGVSEVRKLIKL